MPCGENNLENNIYLKLEKIDSGPKMCRFILLCAHTQWFPHGSSFYSFTDSRNLWAELKYSPFFRF